jgi:transcriptional regulator EpsA
VSQLVILSQIEQEYLLRIVESAIALRDPRQLFLWSQGQLQALLPHQLMVCMQFDPGGALLRIEALHASVLDEAAMARLCDPDHGLALRVARHCQASAALPCMAELHEAVPAHPLAPLREELASCGYDNLIVHGSGPVAGGATVFALFGLPMRPGPRHAYFLSLLLPHLHLALVRLAPPTHATGGAAPARRALSGREADILKWLREGKRNEEIALILGISSLTVKNHLQRIYKLLDVHNRTEAVARSSVVHASIDLAYSQVKTRA